MTAIIILNWNGWKDTLNCIRSLERTKTDKYFIVVGDNGSTDSSMTELESFIERRQRLLKTSIRQQKRFDIKNREIILVDLIDNNGSTAGNNLLIQYAAQYSPDSYLLLNNDAEVEYDTLDLLRDFKQSHPDYMLLTPVIYHYHNRSFIRNAGGKLKWGLCRYNYENTHIAFVKEKEYIDCNFVSSCAMFIDPKVLMYNHTLFMQNFFHGEADFELCHILKARKVKMACVTQSAVFHKSGKSISRVGNRLAQCYMYHLCRFVDLCTILKPVSYYAMLLYMTPKMIHDFRREGADTKRALHIYANLTRQIHSFDTITKRRFFSIMKSFEQTEE